MKRIIFTILVMLPMALMAKGDKELVILHTNDSHSCVMPLNENLADTMLAGRGGYLRRLTMINEERAQNPNLLLLDSGDFSQGSTYYTMFKGDVEGGLMNLMNYDCSTIGNHEFDFGLENMARLFKSLNFPIVCCNYDFTGTVVEGLVKPYIVLKREGVKIGIFGVSPSMEGLVAKSNYVGVEFLDPVKKAAEVVDILRNKEKVDVVICLSHLGWKLEGDFDDQDLVEGNKGIDIVLGGHSHTYLKELGWVEDASGKKVPVDQNGKHAIYVGKIKMELKKR
ncbi:MAG: bifunctional UDP-sugar hydrolase/5'-nucleotidase [Prevotellaceae bacterium]|nr:bifunctional UDP-sugar hydrolase/5'-nucleotidase [Prevotellaceae bacterium]